MEIQKQEEDDENAKHQLYQTLDYAFGKRDHEAAVPRNVRDQYWDYDKTQQGRTRLTYHFDASVRHSKLPFGRIDRVSAVRRKRWKEKRVTRYAASNLSKQRQQEGKMFFFFFNFPPEKKREYQNLFFDECDAFISCKEMNECFRLSQNLLQFFAGIMLLSQPNTRLTPSSDGSLLYDEETEKATAPLTYLEEHKDLGDNKPLWSVVSKCMRCSEGSKYYERFLDVISWFHNSLEEAMNDTNDMETMKKYEEKISRVIVRTYQLEQLMDYSSHFQKELNSMMNDSGFNTDRNIESKSRTKKTTVFISYKKEEGDISLKVKEYLEANGITCWRAPESIKSGSVYADDIADAIAACDAFVLCLSDRAQRSKWIKREIEAADSGDKLIIPFCLDDSYNHLEKGLGLYIRPLQIIQADKDFDQALEDLLNRIRALKKENGNEDR